MDSFIYVFTYLPLRCLQAVYLLGVDLTLSLYHQVFGKTTSRSTAGNESGSESISQKFVRANGYDLMRGFLLVTSVYVLQMLNMSRVYHYIRGQTMIKLYVLTAMLEILDRLLSSFGQDAFDSLSTRMRTFKRTKLTDIYMLAVSYVVVSLYLVIHSSIYFIHVATLTVAINSAEQAMVGVFLSIFSILISIHIYSVNTILTLPCPSCLCSVILTCTFNRLHLHLTLTLTLTMYLIPGDSAHPEQLC